MPTVQARSLPAPRPVAAKTAALPSGTRLAQNAQAGTGPGQDRTNTPAAAPNDKPRLEVPVGPATTPPVGAAAAPPATTTPAPNLDAGAPATTPDVPPVIGNVTEAEGREITDVRVVGNRVIPAETILAQVRTQRGAAFSGRQAELDRGRIDQLGFFATVQSQVTPDINEPNKVVVTFIVVENRVITAYKFVNASAIKDVELVPILSSKIGVVLNRNTVNQDVAAIQKLYTDKGFAVLVQSAVLEDDGTLTFTLQEARISRIELSGLKKTRPDLVRRQIRVKAGDLFDASKLRRDLNRIFDIGFFEDVNFKVDDDPNLPGSVIVTYLLKEKRTGQLSFGIGFDSQSRISGFASVQENNLRGSGKRALLSLETGARRNYEVSYGDPFIGPKNASYDVSVYSRSLFRDPRARDAAGISTTQSFEEQRTGGRINFTKPLDYDRNRTLLFGYRNERAHLFNRDLNGNTTSINLEGTGRVSAFSTGLLRDMRDLRLDPSSGSRQQILVEQGTKILGDSPFTKLDIDLRQYFPLMAPPKPGGQPKLVFASRFVLGKSLNQLPRFEQYYIGGSDTVRGYDAEEQYGDNQYYGNLELRYRFQNKVQFVGFVDAGRSFGGNFSSEQGYTYTDVTDPANPKQVTIPGIPSKTLFSFGAGVRLQTPIGPIRLDVGKGSRGIKTHFAIGPTF